MRIAIIGFGSVGRGVAEVIAAKNTGLIVTAVADSRSGAIDASGLDIAAVLSNKKETGMCGTPDITVSDILSSDAYDVLVEVSPTNAETGEPALGYIREALAGGKHVVTSNKGPVALRFEELHTLAAEHNATLRYEATVCGAIPLMHTIECGIAGNEISRLYGVFNGTCNYILTRMAEEGLTYQQALLEARELGYAEADPTYDVKGIDAAIKLVILANAVWGMKKTLADVDIIGIDGVTSAAIALAEREDQTIRLIGEIDPANGVLRVSPGIIPKSHPLVVRDTLNAVTIETDLAGEITLIGKGAGSSETASAVISDLLFIRDCHGRRD
ncbi:homoserine dehydrogenase [Methanogenium sp. S4BF]|uniref:homoserine dehydrogenase n=1 Tax=Methanogenium sp. S4BF TaxID=1789226 RepID=UPI0024177753|nr:homoserine dehydrogenase [Methanogenium sp. S4BF]WFN35202.1 homoserine dehydrogenase [Methanogenium sp. S4BF]